jgi:hypothetical protein
VDSQEQKMKNRKWKPVALVLVFGFVVVSMVMGFAIKNIASANLRPTEDWRAKEIQALERELQDTNLTEEDRASLEAKLQALYYQLTLQAEGINQLTKMPTQAEAALQTMAKPTLEIEEKRNTGIIENPSVPFSAMDYVIKNAWQEYINGGYLLVYAGSIAKDPDQGILIVCADSNHGCRIFITPQKNGSLQILGYNNSRLIIQQSNVKENIFFDILTLSFAETIDGIVITSAPTETPEIYPQVLETP